jgi:hypothetical protein
MPLERTALTNTRQLIEAYWLHASARDWPAFGALLADDVLYDMPQTRERIRGKAAYVEFNATYPGQWRLEVLRLLVDGARAVSEIAFTVDGEVATGISFFEIENGLITAITDHWPSAYAAPARPISGIEHY